MSRILLDKIEASDDLLDKIELYKARCTHLRDDTSKAKAKAYNLLNENVLEYLKLIESALNRPNPKTEVALHFTQIMIEDVESAIPFFK